MNPNPFNALISLDLNQVELKDVRTLNGAQFDELQPLVTDGKWLLAKDQSGYLVHIRTDHITSLIIVNRL